MYKAQIIKIQKVEKHPNADKLSLVLHNGMTFITALDQYQTGDLAILFMTDGQLSEEYCRQNNLYNQPELNLNPEIKGYLSQKRRVTTQKLRGVVSDGLIMSLNSLSFTGKVNLKINDEFDKINGIPICNKYFIVQQKNGEPQVKQKKTIFKMGIKNFPKHYDTAQLAKNLHMIPEAACVYISEKLHGTSGRTGYVKKEFNHHLLKKYLSWIIRKKFTFVSGTRNTTLNFNKYSNGYRKIIHDQLSTLPFFENEILYYEIVGYDNQKPIQSLAVSKDAIELEPRLKDYKKVDFTYGCNLNNPIDIHTPSVCYAMKETDNKLGGQADIYVYRITINGKDLNTSELVTECNRLGVKSVNFFYRMAATKENILSILANSENNTSYYNNLIKEGIVLRVEHNGTINAYKLKTRLYSLLESHSKSNDSFIDVEEEEQQS
jgi:tRNA-binding EMAP/Myf-like protein